MICLSGVSIALLGGDRHRWRVAWDGYSRMSHVVASPEIGEVELLTDAQLNLGILLADGDGLRRDDIEAYKWLELASKAPEPELRHAALEVLDTLAVRMTAAQIATARKLARDWEVRQLSRGAR